MFLLHGYITSRLPKNQHGIRLKIGQAPAHGEQSG